MGARGFSDTNLLVSPTLNAHVGGLDQRKTPTQMGLCSGGI